MENTDNHAPNYWKLLEGSEAALADGDFPRAEDLYHQADDRRRVSPGRVFLSEKISDGLHGLWRRARTGRTAADDPGRWNRRRSDLRRRFLEQAEEAVREGIRLAELRPEDDAEKNQPVLESALYLVSRSRLFREEPESAVPLLKGLFRTARRTTSRFDVQLVRHDIPLTEEDRLWLARRGGELIEAFVEEGILAPGRVDTEEWASVLMQLLNPQYFGTTGRLEEERAWLEAVTADRFLDRGPAAVASYRSYLENYPAPGPRADEARVRLLEMLANTERPVFPVPRYREALSAMQSAGLSAGNAVAGRYESALARIEFRRPEPSGPTRNSLAWATFSLGAEGAVTVVYWWGDQPRDVARWRPGDDSRALMDFIEPCCGRLVAADAGVRRALDEALQDALPAWTVPDFANVLLPWQANDSSLESDNYVQMALGESGPWRNGWHPTEGHPLLEPPRSSAVVDAWRGGDASRALLAGLVWLGIRGRIQRADPSLRAGIGELARRGDEAAGVLYDFLVLGQDTDRAIDESFSPWTLPLLWTRSDPLSRRRNAAPVPAEGGAQPDLGRNELTLVSAGDAGAVLAAWDDGNTKWRIVLDRPDRIDALVAVENSITGPRTLLPPEGKVHQLSGALELLETLLEARAGRDGTQEGLLPLLHWCRLVETHNGDLMDVHVLWPGIAALPLYARYSELVERLPREDVGTETSGSGPSWVGQLIQRVRKSGLVAGGFELLDRDDAGLDRVWGVFEGSDAAWVMLDSAVIHSRLGTDSEMVALHERLQRRGRRHLSVLLGAAWQRSDVEEWLGRRLAVFGEPYCLAWTDHRAAPLRLAWGGRTPHSSNGAAESFAAAAEQLDRIDRQGVQGVILLPQEGQAAAFWRWAASEPNSTPFPGWKFIERTTLGAEERRDDRRGAILAVPVLRSLERWSWPIAEDGSAAAWGEADLARAELRNELRRACALELAALRSGPWSAVEVLDPRWRCLFPAPAADAQESWRRAGVRVREQAPVSLQAPPAILSTGAIAVRSWLDSLPAEDLPEPGSPPEAPPSGVHLREAPSAEVWAQLAVWLEECWERGATDQYVLLVADDPPAGAAELVARLGGAGRTAWPQTVADEAFGPVFRCSIHDLRDSELIERLADQPPRVVLAVGVRDWLPREGQESLAGAHALRRLLELGSDSVLLQTEPLDGHWIRFLEEMIGSPLGASDRAGERLSAPDRWPDCGSASHPEAWNSRLRYLLAQLRPALAAETALRLPNDGDLPVDRPALAPEHRQVPVRWLARLGGLEPSRLEAGVRALRWAAHLAGDRLSLAAEDPLRRTPRVSHSLLITNRFAVLENLLDRLDEHLRLLLPLWWGARAAGVPLWIDLDHPPVQVEAEELTLVDRLLLEVGARDDESGAGMAFACPAGLLRSHRRLIRCDVPVGEVLDRLSSLLTLFRHRLADVMASATETGEGFLVETGLMELRPEERDFLALGFALGFWSWAGPADREAFPLVDLLTLADSPTAATGGPGWRLLAESVAPAGSDLPARGAPGAGKPQGGSGLGRRLIGGLRSWLPDGEGDDEYTAARTRIDQLLADSDSPGVLVLRGFAGSGRHSVLSEAVAAVRASGIDLPEVTWYCPDSATAAGLVRQARRSGLAGPMDLRLPSVDVSPVGRSDPGGCSGALVVLCEIQRFEPEVRYRLGQLGRGRKLIMTVDPVASAESWENLFLTTPRQEDVVELREQRRICKGLWSPLLQTLPTDVPARAHSLRREHCELVTDYAANLDQCLSRLYREHEEGRLPDRMRLVGAQAGDLDYLGSRIRERGWLSVADKSLDLLVRPGACEFLAAVTDRLSAAGKLAGFRDEGAPPLPPILPALLGEQSAAAARQWLEDVEPPAAGWTLSDFAAELGQCSWAGSFLAYPEASARLERVLANWGTTPMVEVTALPLWEAWWYTVLDDLGMSGPSRPRPLVALAATARPAGTWSPGGIYLCLGTEPPRQHYQVLGRMTDSVLILYQERSPLPGDGNR